MPNLAGVRFESSGPVHYFDAGGIPLETGDRVLVETDGIRGKAPSSSGPTRYSSPISAAQWAASFKRLSASHPRDSS